MHDSLSVWPWFQALVVQMQLFEVYSLILQVFWCQLSINRPCLSCLPGHSSGSLTTIGPNPLFSGCFALIQSRAVHVRFCLRFTAKYFWRFSVTCLQSDHAYHVYFFKYAGINPPDVKIHASLIVWSQFISVSCCAHAFVWVLQLESADVWSRMF